MNAILTLIHLNTKIIDLGLGQMELNWTERFQDSFSSCARIDLVIREIREIEEFFKDLNSRSSKAKTLVGPIGDVFKRIGYTLFQWDISREARLLYAVRNEELLLIDFSAALKHDCLERFKKLKPSEVALVAERRAPIPPTLRKKLDSIGLNSKEMLRSLVSVHSGGDRIKFPEEKTRAWLNFLDAQQRKVADAVIQDLSASTSYQLHLILGGAGTGKTMILRNVAERLAANSELNVEMRVPSGVREYLLSEGGKLPFLATKTQKADVILLDDPITIGDGLEVISEAKKKGIPVVIAIDPIQWHQRRSVEKFEKLLKTESLREYELTINYRQGEKVGQPAIDAIRIFRSRTSEYRDTFREQLNKVASAKFENISLERIRFADKGGTYAFYGVEEYSSFNVLEEFWRVGRFRTERQWPKLLIGSEGKGLFPVGVPNLMENYENVDDTFRSRQRSFQQYEQVRGTEYESVILFIKSSLWKRLVEGVEGAPEQEWEELNAPLTFLTRAENRCVVFEIPDNTPHVSPLIDRNSSVADAIDREFEKWYDFKTGIVT